ncbi:MAG: arginase family protein [Pseudomonadota bacterium]
MTKTSTIAEMFGAADVTTFLGLPECRVSDLAARGARGAILGVPGVTPYASVGAYCAEAPAVIRRAIAGYAANVAHVDFDSGAPIFSGPPNVFDCGDLPFDPDDFAANRTGVREAVTAMLAAGAVPILIGGDDSLPQPMLEAYAHHGPITILQIDAHIDWREEVQGETNGLSSGMRRASEMPHVERIIQVGMRGIGSARQGEVDDARAWGAHIIPARDVVRGGTAAASDLIPEGARVVVCLDVDGLDPAIMPAAIGRAPGGLGYWDVIELIEGAATRGRLAGFEVAEFFPPADFDDQGALVAARIIANVVRLVAQSHIQGDAQ